MGYREAAVQATVEASVTAERSKKTGSSDDHERAQLALRRCRNFGSTGHNARMSQKDTEISFDIATSTT
jgi:hypothetical protein